MRYLIALSVIIIGSVLGILGYQTWTSGPPVTLAAPAKLGLAQADGAPVLRGGWTGASTLRLSVPESTAAGVDIEVQQSDTQFTGNPTQTVPAPSVKSGAVTAALHLPNGIYHLQVRLHSDTGVSPWMKYSGLLRVDTTPPVAPQISSSSDPNPRKTYHTGTLSFDWHSSDDLSGIAGYAYRLDSDPHGLPKQEIRISTPSVKLTGITTGQYYFHTRAVDNAGNWGPTSTFPVKVDVTPPGLSHVRFSAFQFDPHYGSLGVTFAVTKPTREVRVGIYAQNNGALTRLYKLTDAQVGRQLSVSWDGKTDSGAFAPPGFYQIYVRAVDPYGHSSLTGWRDFVLEYKHIYVSLSQQRLWAYDGNKLFLTSLVTSGNQALPTPLGTFHILAKFHPFTFRSPWPKSSPYYYPPSLTQWAMLFQEGGYFIHDAPWRSNFGPGSNAQVGKPGDNYTGTHGCINVPSDIANQLYHWLNVGAVVQVGK